MAMGSENMGSDAMGSEAFTMEHCNSISVTFILILHLIAVVVISTSELACAERGIQLCLHDMKHFQMMFDITDLTESSFLIGRTCTD